MSYAIDLGIDCGASERLADQMLRHFDQLRIRLPGGREVTCDALGKACRLDHWFVGIYPRGMGYGVEDCRPELVESANYETIKWALYDHLSLGSGYRRAYFGSESFDSFACPTPEELLWIDLPDMIFSTEAFPNAPASLMTVPFSPGYVRVIKTG
jgi:hypothetical protein